MKIFNSMKMKTSQKLLVILLPLSLAILLLACSPSTNDKTKPKTKPKPKKEVKTEVTLTSSSANLSAVKGTEVATEDKITITKKPKGATGKWSISPKLSAGLALTGEDNADSATLGGNPTESSPLAKIYTITFTGSGDYESASTTVEVRVTDAPLTQVNLTSSSDKLSVFKGIAVATVDKITITKKPDGATGRWSVDPALPDGLVLTGENNADSATVEGTPIVAASEKTYKIKFTGTGSFGFATTDIEIEVKTLPTLSLSANDNKTDIIVERGALLPMVTITLAGATGAKGKWSIDPTLHSDLTFTGLDDSPTATISGTPGTAQTNTPYTIKFTPDDLSKYDNSIAPTITINIEVSTLITPVSIDEFTLDLLADGSSIDGSPKIATTPPEATGTFSGSLPGGLTLNEDGSITGTPVPSVTATSGEDNDDMFTVTFTGSAAFGDASKKVIVKIYKYRPADRAALISAIEAEMKTQGAAADLNLIDTSAITEMNSLFNSRIRNVFTGDVSKWNVSMVTTMSGMFTDARRFNGDLSKWNVENVKDMQSMFSNALAFNRDISAWNVSKVENMTTMFNLARAFNQNISAWNVSKVKNMRQMFSGGIFSVSAFNQDLTAWKNHIQTGVDVRGMFDGSKVTGALVPCWLDTSTDPDSVNTSRCKE